MALLETRILQTANNPGSINNLNNEMACFGWSVLSVQVTHTQNTKTYTQGLDMLLGTGIDTVETTTIEYATITYQRDRKIENYAQIAAYEQQYLNLRTELAEKVDENESKDHLSFSDFTSLFTLNPIKFIKNTLNLEKKMFLFIFSILGMDTRSKDTIQRNNDLYAQYEQQLKQIRNQCEALL